jgi:hypothetical protein
LKSEKTWTPEERAGELSAPVASNKRPRLSEAASGIWDRLDAEAELEWFIDVRIAKALVILPIAGGFVVLATRLYPPLFHLLVNEDRFLQWLQFLGYLTASIAAVLISFRLHREKRLLLSIAFALLAAGCFFVAGEEISWGQRILGFGTPHEWAEINRQHETNIHNVDEVPFNLTMMLIGAYGSVGAWFVRWRLRGRTPEILEFLFPPLFLTTSFFVLFGYKFLRFTFFTTPHMTVVRMGEWAELCLALALAAFTLLTRRRMRLKEG